MLVKWFSVSYIITRLTCIKICLAFHPLCNHIHSGSILTTSGDNAIIKFYPNELGAVNVSDTKILILNTDDANIYSDTFYQSKIKISGMTMSRTVSEIEGEPKNTNHQKILQELDYNAMAFFIKILERYISSLAY